MDTSNTDVEDEEGQNVASARKLTNISEQLEEGIGDAFLRNDVDDTFENKVAQAKLLLRLQTAYENGEIEANLLVGNYNGNYTDLMKDHFNNIVDLAKQRESLRRSRIRSRRKSRRQSQLVRFHAFDEMNDFWEYL